MSIFNPLTAPSHLKTILLGVWFFGTGLGRILGGIMDKFFLGKILPTYFFGLFAIIIICVSLILLASAKPIYRALR